MEIITLSERQKLILALVIREYAQTAQPVGSKRLLEKYDLAISSATVRNEMAFLVEQGLLRQPHTSAGRVPTEEGYRYFVSQLMVQNELPSTTKRMIAHQFYQARQDIRQWMKLAASVLANQSQAASLVTAPHPTHSRFKHLELIEIRGRQVLMVMVMVGGNVRQRMLTLQESVPQEKLSATANQITHLCQGLDVGGLESIVAHLDELGRDVLKLMREIMHSADQHLAGEIYRDGIINVLAEPEFSEPESARRALRVLEERSLLEDLLAQTVMNSEIGVVQVLIGGEGYWEELSECSMVLARYGEPEVATGTVGVLGPMRMRYGRSISTVRYVAGLLSELVIELHSER